MANPSIAQAQAIATGGKSWRAASVWKKLNIEYREGNPPPDALWNWKCKTPAWIGLHPIG